MNSKAFIGKVIWALDPLSPDRNLIESMAKAIGALCGGETVVVEATAVLSRPLGVHPTPTPPSEASVREFLTGCLALLPSGTSGSVSVLVAPSESTRRRAEVLAQHASRSAADLVALGTHARTGMDRLFLGSFTETFLSDAVVPTLTVNPEVRSSGRLENILFLTDLSRDSRMAFDSLVPLAKSRRARVTLFHRVVPERSLFAPQALAVQSTWIERESLAREEAYRWEQAARGQGVAVTNEISAFGESLPEGFLGAAESFDADLIAMRSRTKRVGTLVVPSRSRFVLRNAPCPVLSFPTT